MPSSIEIHPEAVRLRDWSARLRTELGALLERQDELRLIAGPYIECRYDELLGTLELTLLEAEIQTARLRRRLALVTAQRNLGLRLTAALLEEINRAIETELEEWLRECAAREAQVQQHLREAQQIEFLSPEIVRRLKTAYRALCRRLHPDATGRKTEEFERYWPTVQDAYRNADVELLEALLARLDDPRPPPEDEDLLSLLRRECDRLRALVDRHSERLAAMLEREPYCFEALLEDAEWVKLKRAELRARIETEQARQQAIQTELAAGGLPDQEELS